MLTVLITVFNLIKDFSYFSLVVSYNTGKAIICMLSTILKTVFLTYETLISVLKILYEDFYVFLLDVGQRIYYVYGLISAGVNVITTTIFSIVENIKLTISGLIFIIEQTLNVYYNGIFNSLINIGRIFVWIKQLIILFGSGIWFIITLIPLFLLYLCTLSTYYVGRLIDEITNFLYTQIYLNIIEIYIFVTDVPIESLAGLIAGICIFYVFIQFHSALYTFIYNKFTSLVEIIKSNIHQLYSRLRNTRYGLFKFYHKNNVTESLSGNSDDDVDSNYSRYCIICQEQQKCILFLPCKHVCLCNECNLRLRSYDHTCPVCRTVVKKTMKVFV